MDNLSHSVAAQTNHQTSCNAPLRGLTEEEGEKTAPETLQERVELDAVRSSSIYTLFDLIYVF